MFVAEYNTIMSAIIGRDKEVDELKLDDLFAFTPLYYTFRIGAGRLGEGGSWLWG